MEAFSISHTGFIFSHTSISALACLMKLNNICGIAPAREGALIEKGCDELEDSGYLRFFGDTPVISQTVSFLMEFLARPDACFIIQSKDREIRVYALPGVFCLTDQLSDRMLRITPMRHSRDVTAEISLVHKCHLSRTGITFIRRHAGREETICEMDYDGLIERLAEETAKFDEIG